MLGNSNQRKQKTDKPRPKIIVIVDCFRFSIKCTCNQISFCADRFRRQNLYSVLYTYQDEHGKSCDKWESFPTKEEAVKRQKQIEHELATGNFLIPSTVTVAEFLMDWLPKQCSKHKWAPKTYQSNLALIQNLIIPYIGEMQMQKLRPYHIEALYDTLSKTPCGQYVGGKRRDLSPKQQKRTLSGTTLHEVHQLLHNSFLLAVEWGILIKSPVPVEAPKKFLKWQDAHPEFPRIVFHGLRHSSATYQLMISGGDIKAVQGTTGHASADMLVNTYAHIQQSSRVELGKKFESGFYAKPDTPSPQAVSAAGEPTISMTALLELLKDADPEMKAKLRLALLT